MRLHKCGWVSIQSGERLNGIQEVSGSIPLISTKLSSGNSPFPELFCLLNHIFTSKSVIFQTCPETATIGLRSTFVTN